MAAPAKLTPMLRQYIEIKEQHQNAILFYRMGDFYEMFFDDAKEASKILNITLTSRNNKNDANKVPMCGVPYHAAQNYIAKLVQAGKRVAICEQTEDPAQAKGIVKRAVTRIISPGVITDDQLLDEKENRYVCAITGNHDLAKPEWGISFLDVSTGHFLAGEFSDHNPVPEQILDQISRMNPAEILINEQETDFLNALLDQARILIPGLCLTPREETLFELTASSASLREHFNVLNLDGFGCGSFKQGIIAAAVLLDYIAETQKTEISHIEKLTPINLESVLLVDDSSRRNLELLQTIIGSKRDGSLLSVLDRTCTPMGARLLKHNILFPLQDKKRIQKRLDSVGYFHHHGELRGTLREALASIYDIERLNSRMVLGHGNGRDAVALRQSLSKLPEIHALLKQCRPEKIRDIADRFDDLADLQTLLLSAVADEPPITLRDGNLIRAGYNQELDELVALLRDGKQLILDLEAKEREATGLTKLKVAYNKVFGYFIEVSKSNSDNVPDHYIRKQTLVNAERFITPELKEFESKVLNAQERRLELEYQLFVEVRNRIAANSSRLITCAHLLAQIDVFCSLAEVARLNHYRKPEINTDEAIIISEGRHPVIEKALPSGKFVPNDVVLDQAGKQVLIITGPNMAGKSTILRQTALIVLMAQMGSFVPAASATIGIVDRIFTRVGAMDDLRKGQSTFMVEMSETANILNNATTRSLVILDEIGRGTSTFDGLSIAWAVAEALVNKDDRGIKTMFATHYHELTELARTHERIQNFSVAVKEWNDTIIFLHKLVSGGTNRSYGIQVAALAGVPAPVVKRAEEILRKIEHGELDYQAAFSPRNREKTERSRKPSQLPMFPTARHPVLEELKKTSIDDLTPRQALELLYRLEELSQS
ncbi:MAG: DNA mismatch repair protein MutS [Desulfobacterales bacterium]|nr:MAG: DNA mismatch repair protein MutS [Desulfobacterales bacterium]